ncbi:YgaP family membrane protein [Bacillus canaveralius]|uniref:YgaP family membrane protein n=1 Tax=Bacillus canaveralius TaxID=1403243 RepID=UPI00269DBC97
MKVTPNIGIINALIRITVGLTILSWSTAKLVKKPRRDSYLVMAMLGGMKVAEGIVRFCPVTALFENRQENMQNRDNRSQQNTKEYGDNRTKQKITQNNGNDSQQDTKENGDNHTKQKITQSNGNDSQQDAKQSKDIKQIQEKIAAGGDIKKEMIDQLLQDNPL